MKPELNILMGKGALNDGGRGPGELRRRGLQVRARRAPAPTTAASGLAEELPPAGAGSGRRGQEAMLRESEGRFRTLVQSVRDYAICLLDATGRVATWHAGAEWVEGYQADEIIGQHFSRFYPVESVAVGQPTLALVWAVTEGRFEEETLLVRKDQFPFWARVVITSLRDERERVSGFAFVVRDITRQKLGGRREG
jgi:PAS domain S-box-containing protein